MYNEYIKALDFLENNLHLNNKPKIALILGSGLSDIINSKNIEVKAKVSYSEIPDFPVSTVEGHSGKLIYAYYKQTPLIIMQGRVHFYEGYSIQEVVFPIRLLCLLGVENLLLTNAAGAVNKDFRVGDIMAITDHISCFVPNPLIGGNDDNFGVRFPAMNNIYNNMIIEKISQKYDIKKGVYCQLTGPSYETPAEIRMLHTLGADAVGMSTVVEAITAKHCGMNVVGLSVISNIACDTSDNQISHTEVQQAVENNKQKVIDVIEYAINLIAIN